MNVRQLQEYLNKSKAVFELKEHDEPLKNAKDAVNYFDAELVAAVYVIHTERGLAAMIVNAERDKMDTESINYVLGYKVKGLTIHDYIYGSTGDPRYTVKLRPEDVIRLSEMLAFIE